MEKLGRRSMLRLLAGIGAAAACGMKDAGPAEAATLANDAAVKTAVGAAPEPAAESVDSQLETNQYYFRRRRRRRVFFFRRYRRRRFFYRPRRFYRVRYYRRRRFF